MTEKQKAPSILQRIAEKDKTAVADCINTYGDFIWALAKKHTTSTKEAELVTRKIFIDIWQYCEQPVKTPPLESKLIAMITLRQLIKPL